MNKRILIIVESINSNDSSGSKANVALIKNLAAIGYSITVLHYTRKPIDIKNTTCIAIQEKKYTMLYILSRTQRLIQRYFKINLARYLEPIFGFSFTFFNDVNSIKAAIKKIYILEYDLILTLSKGASFRPHYAVNKLPDLHNKWLTYIHDPYPFSCYPPPYNYNEPSYKQQRLFFEDVSKHAKYSAFPSQLLNDWMGSYFPHFLKTGIILPHQLSKIQARKPENLKYFDDKNFNILHAGNLLKPRNPEGLILGFKVFLKNNPKARKNSKLILIGNAYNMHKALIKTHAHNIPQLEVQFLNMPFNEVFYLQKKASVNVIIEAKSIISPFLPGKFPHCVAANKTILHLGPKHSETMRLLGEAYTYHTEIDAVKTIATILEHLYYAWLEDPKAELLNRPDLEYYVSMNFLKKTIQSLVVD